MLKKYALPILAPDGGGGAATAAPPAPAPAAPAPAATPSPAPAAAPARPANPFAKVDSRKPAAPAKPAAAAPDATTPAATPPAQTPPAATTPAATPPQGQSKPSDAKQLREAYEKAQAELKAKNESHSALEAKIADFEKRGKDAETLKTRLEQLEKDIATRDAELRALKHETDPAFKEKFEKPFHSAAEYARSEISSLSVTDESGASRPATWDDFAAIYALPPGKAIPAIKAMFGEDFFGAVLGHYQTLKRLENTRNVALQEERENYKARQAEEDAKQIRQREDVDKAWKEAQKEISEGEPDYQVDPTDKELTDIYKESLALVEENPKTIQERIVKNAHVKFRAAMFPVLKFRLQKALQEIETMKAEASSGGVPGKTRRGGGESSSAPTESGWEEGLRKAVSNA